MRVDSVGTLASTVLGFVGTDENGLDGFEYSQDALLRGRSGSVMLEADEFGHPIPFGQRTNRQAGRARIDRSSLTIDSYLQFVAERALFKQVFGVSRARRHGDRNGSVHRRSARPRERAGFRSEQILEI